MSAQEVVELLIQAARVVLAEREGAGLTSAQWMALRFFSRANTFSRTLSGLAAYQATTRGTASQTIKLLERDGYLERERSTRDRRSSVLGLTPKGRKVLAEDPVAGLVHEIDAFDEPVQLILRNTLRHIVAHLTNGHPRKPAGSCRDCFFLLARRSRPSEGVVCTKLVCKAIGLPIEEPELDLLCMTFQPSAKTSERG